MEKYIAFDSEEILRTVMDKFMSLELDDDEHPDNPCFKAHDLWSKIERLGETTSDQGYEYAFIHAIPNNYSDAKLAVHRDRSFSLDRQCEISTVPLSETRGIGLASVVVRWECGLKDREATEWTPNLRC